MTQAGRQGSPRNSSGRNSAGQNSAQGSGRGAQGGGSRSGGAGFKGGGDRPFKHPKPREEAFIDIKQGYVDTGASPNQTKPVFTSAAVAGAKKLKKKKKFLLC